jgi:flagellar biosynthesis/type III secretory pathway chaperone
MNNPALISKQIVELFQKQFKATRQLLKTLKKEYDCLNANDVTALEGIVANKQKCAVELERHEKALFDLLAQAGYQSDNNGLKAFLQDTQSNPSYTNLHNAWNVLLKTILECNKQNVINAQIINVASITIKQALNLLGGRDNNNDTYAKSGKTIDGGKSTSFTVA